MNDHVRSKLERADAARSKNPNPPGSKRLWRVRGTMVEVPFPVHRQQDAGPLQERLLIHF